MDWQNVVDHISKCASTLGIDTPISIAILGDALAAGIQRGGKIEYGHDIHGNIVLPPGAPFDGEPVLIKLGEGWVEARWEPASKEFGETVGFCWVCLDDSYENQELDDAKFWLPVPKDPD